MSRSGFFRSLVDLLRTGASGNTVMGGATTISRDGRSSLRCFSWLKISGLYSGRSSSGFISLISFSMSIFMSCDAKYFFDITLFVLQCVPRPLERFFRRALVYDGVDST